MVYLFYFVVLSVVVGFLGNVAFVVALYSVPFLEGIRFLQEFIYIAVGAGVASLILREHDLRNEELKALRLLINRVGHEPIMSILKERAVLLHRASGDEAQLLRQLRIDELKSAESRTALMKREFTAIHAAAKNAGVPVFANYYEHATAELPQSSGTS